MEANRLKRFDKVPEGHEIAAQAHGISGASSKLRARLSCLHYDNVI